MHVILLCTTEYQNFVNVSDNIGINQIKNNLIHSPLKCTWGIFKPKWYNEVLKPTIPTRKNRFVYIFLSNRYVEIIIPINLM